jgi:hypothetical protein
MNVLSFSPDADRQSNARRTAGFAYECLTGASTAYQCCDGNNRPDGTGGVLAKGAKLWLRGPLTADERKSNVTAFAEQVGTIRVPARQLIGIGKEEA